MVPAVEKFQHVLTTPGDPTSELLARIFRDDLEEICKTQHIAAHVTRLRSGNRRTVMPRSSNEDF